VPFYGYEWTHVTNENNGLFEPGTPVCCGSEYNYIMTIASRLQKFRDPTTKALWLRNGSNFWTYDDPVSLAFKMEYVQEHHLAGVMIWEISGDEPDGLLLKNFGERPPVRAPEAGMVIRYQTCGGGALRRACPPRSSSPKRL
jgi:chitinase